MNTRKFSDAISEIDDKYYEEAANYQHKPHAWVRWVSITAGLGIMLLALFFILPNYFNQQGVTSPDNPNSGTELVVNHLDTPPSIPDVDVQLTHYDKLPYDMWKSVEKDFYAFANISYDDFVALIPEAFRTNITFYSLATKDYKASEQDDQYSLHDYVFDCQSNDGAQVTIALCNFEAPIRDCFIDDENPQISNVNETPVTIYGYNNMYMIHFSHKGINYDIETKDMDLNQLQELLTNIIS